MGAAISAGDEEEVDEATDANGVTVKVNMNLNAACAAKIEDWIDQCDRRLRILGHTGSAGSTRAMKGHRHDGIHIPSQQQPQRRRAAQAKQATQVAQLREGLLVAKSALVALEGHFEIS